MSSQGRPVLQMTAVTRVHGEGATEGVARHDDAPSMRCSTAICASMRLRAS